MVVLMQWIAPREALAFSDVLRPTRAARGVLVAKCTILACAWGGRADGTKPHVSDACWER